MKRATAGFTLIEMMVVIGIIVVLILISVPSLTAARNSAKSRAAGNYGSLVALTINGFLATRPGLTIDTMLNANPGFGTGDTTGTSFVTNGVVKDCGQGYTLNGGSNSFSASAGGTSSVRNYTWSAADNGAHCVISKSTTSNSPYAFSVFTWNENTPNEYYINGQKK